LRVVAEVICRFLELVVIDGDDGAGFDRHRQPQFDDRDDLAARVRRQADPGDCALQIATGREFDLGGEAPIEPDPPELVPLEGCAEAASRVDDRGQRRGVPDQ